MPTPMRIMTAARANSLWVFWVVAVSPRKQASAAPGMNPRVDPATKTPSEMFEAESKSVRMMPGMGSWRIKTVLRKSGGVGSETEPFHLALMWGRMRPAPSRRPTAKVRQVPRMEEGSETRKPTPPPKTAQAKTLVQSRGQPKAQSSVLTTNNTSAASNRPCWRIHVRARSRLCRAV